MAEFHQEKRGGETGRGGFGKRIGEIVHRGVKTHKHCGNRKDVVLECSCVWGARRDQESIEDIVSGLKIGQTLLCSLNLKLPYREYGLMKVFCKTEES